MKTWVKILAGLVVLVVLVAVVGVIVISSMDFNKYKGLIAEQIKKATGRDLVINGDLTLKISLTPRIAVAGVTFANAPWGSKPHMVTIDRFAAEVQLIPLISGQIKINQVILEGVELLAEKNKAGKVNWEFGPAAAKPAEQSSDGSNKVTLPIVRTVHFKDISIVYNDAQAGQNYNLKLASVDLKSDGLDAPLNLVVKGAVNRQDFSVGGSLGSLHTVTGGGMTPVNLKIEALKMTVGINGKAGTPGGTPKVDVKLTVDGESVEKTLAAAAALAPNLKGLELPIKGAFNITSGVTVDGATNIALSNLNTAVGPLAMTGSLGATLGGARPAVKAVLKTDTLNLDQLLPKQEGQKKAAKAPAKDSGAGDGRVFPDDPLPVDGLKAADADVKFDAAKIIMNGMQITNVTLSLSLKNGRLSIDPLGAVLAGGKIDGQVLLDTSRAQPSLKANITANQIDYGVLLTQRGMSDMATGKVDVKVNVTGSGTSIRRLMAGLNGTVGIVTKDGKLESNALNVVSADIANFLNNKDSKTIICGVVHFNITQGLANVHALVFETGSLSIIGTGSTNLADESLKLRVDPRSKKTNVAKVALVPVNIKGTYAKPGWELDTMATAGNVAAGAARVGGAIATGGLSLLVEKVAKETVMKTDTTDYCTPALAGKKVVPGTMTEAEAKPSEPAPSQPGKRESSNPVESVTKGIGSGLKNLLGK